MAYSEDFKQLVLKKLRQGWTIRRAAKEFGIAISTVTLW
ncbi:helix-turn-helix domain-containing protein, partial [Neisseria yangbaofengii]